MKILTTLIIFALLLGSHSLTFAQPDNGGINFAQAQEAFDNSQYEKALTLLDQLEKISGKAPRVESLRALTLKELNRHKEAYESLLVYFQLTAKLDLSKNEAHQSLIQMRDELKEQLERQLQNEKDKLQAERNKTAEKVTSETGKTTNQPAKNDPLAEIEMWNKVKESNTASDYYLFIERFPNSVYVKSAREKMNAIGDSEWDKVKQSKDPFAIREYLKNNPNSAFAEQAKTRMNMLAESIIEWEKIKDSSNLEDFKNYIAKFPAGAHSEEAVKIRDAKEYQIKNQARLKEADRIYKIYQAMAQESYNEAVRNLNNNVMTGSRWDADRAVSMLTQVIELNPNHDEAYWSRGGEYRHYFTPGTSGLRDYNKSIELKPTAWKYRIRGEWYDQLKDYSRAFNDYTKALELVESESYAVDVKKEFIATCRFFRGYIYSSRGDYESAVKDYTVAIEHDPTDVRFYRFRMEAYQKLGRKDLAKADKNKLKELEGN